LWELLTKYKLKLNAATTIIKIHVDNNHCYSDKYFSKYFFVTTSAIKLFAIKYSAGGGA
jgi:hypothetical protein